MPTTTRSPSESLGARIVRLATQQRVSVPSKPRSQRRDHEYVRERAKALAVLRDHTETRGELARKLGQASGAVIGFHVFRAEEAALLPRLGVRIGGGGGWIEPPPVDHVGTRVASPERPTKRRGRPGRRGRLVAALARSRTY